MNCLPFRSIRVHTRFLVGFVLLDLQFYMYVLLIVFLSFCTFSFGYCVVCSSSIYGFRLPLWYPQALLVMFYLCSTLPCDIFRNY